MWYDSCGEKMLLWRYKKGAMNLDTYFEFLGPDDIRIRGHRVGIDDVLNYYLDGYSPDEIAAQLPTLSLVARQGSSDG
jgi:hypothetical protein